MTALHAAAEYGVEDAIDELVRWGAIVDAVNKYVRGPHRYLIHPSGMVPRVRQPPPRPKPTSTPRWRHADKRHAPRAAVRSTSAKPPQPLRYCTPALLLSTDSSHMGLPRCTLLRSTTREARPSSSCTTVTSPRLRAMCARPVLVWYRAPCELWPGPCVSLVQPPVSSNGYLQDGSTPIDFARRNGHTELETWLEKARAHRHYAGALALGRTTTGLCAHLLLLPSCTRASGCAPSATAPPSKIEEEFNESVCE